MTLTRREFNGLMATGLAGAPFARLGAWSVQASKIAGVRVGTQSYSFRDRGLDEAIAGMQAAGLSYCELWSGHVEGRGAITVPEGGDRRDVTRQWRMAESTRELFRGIRRKFDQAGITLTSYDVPFNNSFTDAEIAGTFELAKALGVGVVTSSARVSVAERLQPWADKAGLKVGFHNHSRIAPDEFATPDDFAKALKAGPNMGITLDIGHFTAANFDALAFLDEHHDRIVSMHIKDRMRDQGATVPFGQGEAPVAAVLRRLRDRKWDIPAHIEFEYKGNTDEEMKRLLAYCRQVLEEK
jgi:sugar phosphate isomerase/epimerase